MEGSMAIEFKSRKRVWIGELNIWSTIWNNAIHPMMKITQSCVVSMIYNMWNGTIKKCLAREFRIMLKQITNLIFQVKIQLLWMLLQGKNKDARARDNKTTNKLLANSLKLIWLRPKMSKETTRNKRWKRNKKNLPLWTWWQTIQDVVWL